MSGPAVYAFYSVKGGVGKTTLAVTAAVGFAAAGRKVAILDADFMGTSFADGLHLCAPDLLRADGRLDWRRAPALMLDRAETLRRRRTSAGSQPTLPYLDELVFGRRRRFAPETIAWSHPEAPGVSWYPSSPAVADSTRAALRLLGGGGVETARRMAEVARSIGTLLGPEGVLIIDLPPALYGAPTLVADVFVQDPWYARFVPVLVTTPDLNDLYRSVEVFFSVNLGFRWILNRNSTAAESSRDRLRAYLGDQWRLSRVEDQLRDLGWSEPLSRLYQGGTLALPELLTRRLLQLLEGL